MRTIAITGSGSGIGAALRDRLESDGDRVIGVDVRGAEVIADLSTQKGRETAVAEVLTGAGFRLDGLVVCAGIGPQAKPVADIVSVNYFGAASLLAALRPTLIGGDSTSAVAVSSNSATIVPNADGPLADACLAGDEERARALAAEMNGSVVYAAAKLALARFVRRNAPRAEWAGEGIRLNAVAPGAVETPLLKGGLDDPLLGPAIRNFPIPLRGFGRPSQIADAIAFLLSPAASFCCGSVLFVDGGSDAMMRGDQY